MKIQIRQGVFETNSSSTHSVAVCLSTEWDAFGRGELWISPYSGKMLPRDEAEKFNEELISKHLERSQSWSHSYTREDIIEDYRTDLYMSYQDYYAWAETTYYEFFDMGDKLSNGVGVVTYGYYGHDY